MPTSEHFSESELSCHCCGRGVEKISSKLLELLEQLRANIGGPLEISCAYRCPAHNAEVGGVPNSQHVLGTAADVQTPNYEHCHTPEQLQWYCEQLPFDAIGLYSWGCHVDVREGGIGAGIRFQIGVKHNDC